MPFITKILAAPEYNCSAYTQQEWRDQFGEPQILMGTWSIAFATVCQLMYLPSLRVFFRERRSTCFKIMFFLAMADMGGLTITGTFFGYAVFNGMVFCSDVVFETITACGAFLFWACSTCTCVILVVNRICELTERATLFQGWRSTVCLGAVLVYGIWCGLFTRPVLPNSSYVTLSFDPYIPGHTAEEYPNIPNMYHNFCVAFFVPILYFGLCMIIRKNSHRFQDSNTTQALQAKIFMQGSIITCGNFMTAAAWLIQMFVPTPQFVITGGMFTIQSVHGLPCFIYLFLNKSVRDELRKMLGKQSTGSITPKAFTSVNTNTVSTVTPIS